MVSTATTLVVGFVVGVTVWALLRYIRGRSWNVDGSDDAKRKELQAPAEPEKQEVTDPSSQAAEARGPGEPTEPTDPTEWPEPTGPAEPPR